MKQGVSVFYKLYCERADGKTDSNKKLGSKSFNSVRSSREIRVVKMKLVEIDIADILNGGEERLEYWSAIVIEQFKEIGFLRSRKGLKSFIT